MSHQDFIVTSTTSTLVFVASFAAVLHLQNAWDNLLAWQFEGPIARYSQLRMSEQYLADFLRWWSLLLGGVTFVLLFLLHAYPLALTFFALFTIVPPCGLRFLIGRRELLLESQLISAATGLANALKAGLSIPQSLKTVAEETAAPLSAELNYIVYQFDHGRPLKETLAGTRKRLQLEPFTLFCLALEVAVERGGRINVAMERLSASLREWFRLRRKLTSDTAAGRFAVFIMGLCPAGFILFFYLAGQDDVLFLFTNFWGQILLSIIILLVFTGLRITARITNISLN